MQAILKFDLSEHEDIEAYKMHTKADNYHCAIGVIVQKMCILDNRSQLSDTQKYKELKDIIKSTLTHYDCYPDLC